MTALTEWFCDYCNASHQRREEGDEVVTGYARTIDAQLPDDWWTVPGKGPGKVGHACPDCITSRVDVRDDIIRRRSGGLERLKGAEADHDTDLPGGWPARTSPFGDQTA